MGSRFPEGFGVRLFAGGITPNVIGFGNLPLLPHLCLRRHMILSVFLFLIYCCGRNFYIFLCTIT
jgi:hypothetical protein